jgi:hypothetical protein
MTGFGRWHFASALSVVVLPPMTLAGAFCSSQGSRFRRGPAFGFLRFDLLLA